MFSFEVSIMINIINEIIFSKLRIISHNFFILTVDKSIRIFPNIFNTLINFTSPNKVINFNLFFVFNSVNKFTVDFIELTRLNSLPCYMFRNFTCFKIYSITKFLFWSDKSSINNCFFFAVIVFTTSKTIRNIRKRLIVVFIRNIHRVSIHIINNSFFMCIKFNNKIVHNLFRIRKN